MSNDDPVPLAPDEAEALAAPLSRKAVARLFHVTPSRIGQLVDEGVLRPVNGKFVLAEVVGGYIEHLKKTGNTEAKLQQEERIRTLKIERLQIEQAARLEELIPKDEAKAWVMMCSGVWSRLLAAFAPRVLAALAAAGFLTTSARDPKARRIVEAETDKLREEFLAAIEPKGDEAA
jgi:hypothetical protein